MSPHQAATLEEVKKYYGQTLRGTDDLKTGACCAGQALPAHLRLALGRVDDEIKAKFYGCGSPIPPAVDGLTVLDLGCGTGRDVYVLSQLVGQDGRVIGLDMTEQQLEVAKRHLPGQMKCFGYDRPNVEFKRGYIEDLAAVGIEDASIDVVVSNCVLNLSPDKRRVFSEILRVLKPGGELYFADIFAGRRVPAQLQTDPILRGECLGGALYFEDFRRLLEALGCPDYRVVSRRRIDIKDAQVQAKAGMIDFHSATVRAFKLDSLEDRYEDYGQLAIYRGTIPEAPHAFELDQHHLFIANKALLVCGNTAAMLGETRFAKHFTLLGDKSTHFGPFECAPAAEIAADPKGQGGGCC